jgi:flagellar hook-length control protein FliK
MAQLRAALQAQGLNVEKLEVTQSSTAAQLTNQQFGSGQQGGQPSDERQGLRDGDFVSDNAFETEIAEQAAIQGLGYGRAINETA